MKLPISSKLLLFTILNFLYQCESSRQQQKRAAKSSLIHFEEEILLKNVRQLTFGSGQNTRSSFSKDGKSIAYDGSGSLKYGTKCVQLYQLDLRMPNRRAYRLSSGLGICRASSYYPNASGLRLQSKLVCQVSKCKSSAVDYDPALKDICQNSSKLYELDPHLEIFQINQWGNFRAQLTSEKGYDSEAKISPNGQSIVYTSVQAGHPQLWIMSAVDGQAKNSSQTHMVSKKRTLQLYIVGLDGSGLKQITFNEDGRDIFPTVDCSQKN
uniref:Uncharacterized protein n=1 Tax=Ditylenchus dipsaci TaxID=166011 RepID=A0A915ELX3_9BILA